MLTFYESKLYDELEDDVIFPLWYNNYVMCMKLISDSFIEIKKSKFYGYLYEIDSKEDIDTIINSIKNGNKGYRHLPYAYKLINTAGKSNDKEPGEIGLSFLNILERNNLNSHLLLVLRYFGGVKLGASVLSRTYSKCANLCIKTD